MAPGWEPAGGAGYTRLEILATGGTKGKPAVRLTRGATALAGALLVALAGLFLRTQGVTAGLFGGAAPARPTGPLPVRRGERVLVAPATHSHGAAATIPVAVWQPDVGDALEEAPVILYAPGWGGRRDGNEVTLRHLASHGYVTVAFDDVLHDPPDPAATAEDEAARRAPLDLTSMETFLAVAERRARLIARKATRVLDALAAGGARLGRCGMLGFSLGGSAAAAAARHDPRLQAVVNLDGGTYGETARLGVDGPYLVLNAEFPPRHPWLAGLSARLSAARATAERLDREEHERQLAQAARPRTLSVVIAGAGHGDFTDELHGRARWRSWRPWRGPLIPPARQRAIVDAWLLAFFDTWLRDRPSPLITQRRSPFPEARVLGPAAGAAGPD